MRLNWLVKTFDELTNHEVYRILHLRNRIFAVDQQSIYLDADNYDQKAIHLCAYHNNQIVAYARIFLNGAKIQSATFGRVLVDEAFRRHNIGKELVKRCIDILHKDYNENQIQIEAQLYLQLFYESFGFKTTGEPYVEDNIPHIRMTLLL